jgi:WD40 repeat protein
VQIEKRRPSGFAPRIRLGVGGALIVLVSVLTGCGQRDETEVGDGPFPDVSGVKVEIGTQRSTSPIEAAIPAIRLALPTAPQPSGIAFSPDGSLLAASDSRGVVLWDLGAGGARATLKDQPIPATGVEFLPDGSSLATMGYRFDPFITAITLWDPSDGDRLRAVAESPRQLTAMALVPGGESMVVGLPGEQGGGMPGLIDLGSGEVGGMPIGLIGQISLLGVSPDGSTAACGAWATVNYMDRGELVLVDLASNTERARPELEIGRFNDLAFSPDGTELIVSYLDRGAQWRLRVLDPRSGEVEETIEAVSGEVSSLAISPDGSLIGLGGGLGGIQLLDRGLGTIVQAPGFHDRAIEHLAFAPDGKTLASCGGDRRIALWDVEALTRGDSGAAE